MTGEAGKVRTYIVLLNWNGWEDTLRCVASLRGLACGAYRLVIVDNGSTDGSAGRILEWATGQMEPVRFIVYDEAQATADGVPEREAELESLPPADGFVLIRLEENRGYAGGNAAGIHYALARGAEYLWLLNNDTVVEAGSLAAMVECLEADTRAGVCGAKVLAYDQPDTLLAAGGGWFVPWTGLSHHYGWLERDRGQWDRSFEPFYVTGACLLAKAQVFREVGGMKEEFFLYGEELEWQMRARSAGWRTVYCPEARVWHKENAASGYKSPTVEYYYTRNMLWLTRRHAPGWLPTAVAVHGLRLVSRLLRGQTARAAAVARGIQAGLHGRLGREGGGDSS